MNLKTVSGLLFYLKTHPDDPVLHLSLQGILFLRAMLRQSPSPPYRITNPKTAIKKLPVESNILLHLLIDKRRKDRD
ncbi:hypothetical protein MSSAC_2094 [Methanosarcina siciliae C2J]|uniref:Uncharacterized protein n=3 Tax=Methanosarcina siciliae TaxID=38027 RepID=A0A0E3PD50_9EURY|nr:hypothetical protein MSSIT_1735 [Methanosarcina siciliae T4/M]AKB32364.1 hypothetical protein MSSIH_1674 [Methanosarcina siciliae HI350]AKB36684.1 hypothetical protein MSSAC_2094 [Methanosarcina siciliae C2J]